MTGGGAGEVNRVRLPTAKDQVVFISGDRTQISRARTSCPPFLFLLPLGCSDAIGRSKMCSSTRHLHKKQMAPPSPD